MNNDKQLILFDGVCSFCNFWVNFVIKRDRNDLFRFASLQSDQSRHITGRLKIDVSNLDTFVLIIGTKFYIRSTAALMVCKELTSPIKILYPLIFLPEFLRDFFYGLIAKNRYGLFGRREACRIPNESDKAKFLM